MAESEEELKSLLVKVKDEEEAMIHWIHLGKHKHTPFPVRLVSQISIVLLTRLGTKWAEEEVFFNSSKCFSALVKISPCGKFKKFKTN